MKFNEVLKYKKSIIATTLAIGLGALSVFLWPSCSSHVPKPKAPSPTEEILHLKSELTDLSTARDDLTTMNLRLVDENRVLRAMLVDCMQRHMDER